MTLRLVKDDEVPEEEPKKLKIPLKDYLTFVSGAAIIVLGFGALLILIAMANS
tara:strand:+ start:2269 stop:2427 length:159 start_codon:yes stop_codon:yes gene_type:complete